MTPDATFVKWREIEDNEPLALFKITNPDHKFYGRTVSWEFCMVNKVNIPPFPSFSVWIKQEENR